MIRLTKSDATPKELAAAIKKAISPGGIGLGGTGGLTGIALLQRHNHLNGSRIKSNWPEEIHLLKKI